MELQPEDVKATQRCPPSSGGHSPFKRLRDQIGHGNSYHKFPVPACPCPTSSRTCSAESRALSWNEHGFLSCSWIRLRMTSHTTERRLDRTGTDTVEIPVTLTNQGTLLTPDSTSQSNQGFKPLKPHLTPAQRVTSGNYKCFVM
ncbi:unnamed protein product [Pleuronectes platessa]|uniref:Uncharacterized protein n=1 Tax=Pleuronectes platessa TaxID=8262 RepID=A0A9N7ZD07_PLEPL|nr:unnamed protein product [Pleuronectes platessa]